MKNIQSLFIKLANPNKQGISRIVFTDEFDNEYSKLKNYNGSHWSRFDKKNVLTSTYKYISITKTDIRFSQDVSEHEKEDLKHMIDNLDSIYEKRKQTKSNKVIAYKLFGFKEKSTESRHIGNNIRKYFNGFKCCVLGTSAIEIDHKNGRYNDQRVNDIQTQTIDDFQPLSKAANLAKRQHCKMCKKTGIRFDAKIIGHKISFTEGSEKYIESKDGCKGCYWHGVKEFKLH